ncbi:MAG TPA: dihydropteroate synthase [Acidimicrobiales bacterium]|nr:dihydropteroate synthase [Acidimicrobiales bacterium]
MTGQQHGRPLVMGVLNVTPDSFSDGGRYVERDRAVERGLAMVAEGADLVDVGGESSRPGATPVAVDEELRRVVPVLLALAGRVRLSVDTTKEVVARAAVAAGATLLNDISGRLWPVAAAEGVGWVAMHMQGTPADMQLDPHYGDVVGEVHRWLLERLRTALDAGVEEVWVDQGIGFGKTAEHNLALLAHLDELVEATAAAGGRGVLVGTSRKRFLGAFGAPGDEPLGPDERLEASLATAVWAMAQGAGMVRVHDVAPTVVAAGLVGLAEEAAVPVGGSMGGSR